MWIDFGAHTNTQLHKVTSKVNTKPFTPPSLEAQNLMTSQAFLKVRGVTSVIFISIKRRKQYGGRKFITNLKDSSRLVGSFTGSILLLRTCYSPWRRSFEDSMSQWNQCFHGLSL